MRKLNLEDYMVKILNPDGTFSKEPYKFREAIINLMFHPNLRLGEVDLLDTADVVRKIRTAEKSILLEEEEFERVKNAISDFKGFTENEVELVRRIKNCPEVNVKEK